MTILIACHSTADFDALAGACGMALVYPGAKIILPGGAERAVHEFIEEYGLPCGTLISLKELEKLTIGKLVLIDCHDPEQLGLLTEKLPTPRPPLEVVDHHTGSAPETGATSTLVVERLRAAGLTPPPLLATLLLIGIHEDTGSFTFNEVRPRDHAAAGWLWECKPDPALLRRWLAFHAPAVPGALLELLRGTELLPLGRVTVALVEIEDDLPDPARVPALNALLELTGADGALLAQIGRGRVSVAARGDGRKFDAGALCARLGGGGHPTAASASLPHLPRAAAHQAILAALQAHFPPPALLADLHAAPLEFAREHEPVAPLLARLEALRLKRVPVFSGRARVPAGKALLGVVTTSELREAVRHGHGGSAAGAFAHGGAEIVSEREPIAALAGRPAVGDPLYLTVDARGRVRGALSRRRLLATFAPAPAPDRPSRLGPDFLRARLGELPAPLQKLLAAVRRAARARKAELHLVGGPVRDLLLGRPLADLDIACDQPLEGLLAPLSKLRGVKVIRHERFGTATVSLGGATIDLARTRREHYTRPGALPEVAPAVLADDLRRRDFTLNAMAIKLPGADPEPPQLVDPLGGLADLRAGRLRALHGLSFIEDPTRMLRAVRFLTRFHFTLAPDTARLLREAVRLGALARISGERLAAELTLIADGPEPLRALEWLDETGLLGAILPGAGARGVALERTRAVQARLARHRAEFPAERPDPLAMFLWPLLCGMREEPFAAALARLALPTRTRKLLQDGRDLRWRAGPELRRASPGPQLFLARLEPEEVLWLAALPPAGADAGLLDGYLRVGRFRRPVLKGGDLKKLGLKPGPKLGELHRELTARVQAGELSGRAAELKFVKSQLLQRGKPARTVA